MDLWHNCTDNNFRILYVEESKRKKCFGFISSCFDFIFYGNLNSAEGSVKHLGDNLTGDGDGDDEAVQVNLPLMPSDIRRLVFAVTIHEAEARHQNFGMVRNAFMRVVNQDTQTELARFDLSEDFSIETAVIFGELYQHNGEWKFRAVGQGYAGGLGALAQNHGVNVA